MTTQRDDMAGHGAADPARGQADPSEPMTGQIVPPPRVDSEPDQPTGAASLDDPAADPDRVVLDDPVQADDLEATFAGRPWTRRERRVGR